MKDTSVQDDHLGVDIKGRERVKGEVKNGWKWSMNFVYLYENKIVKPLVNIISRGGVWERMMGEWI
jgi:hypothetical protein